MKINYGGRVVFIFDKFVIKIPRLRFRRVILDLLSDRDWFLGRLDLMMFHDSVKESWREFVQWSFQRNPYLAPMILPFVFQKLNGVGAIDANAAYYELYEFRKGEDPVCAKLRQGLMEYDTGGISHTVKYPNNFALHDGRVYLLDYGADGLAKFLKKYGDEFFTYLAKWKL